MIHAFGHENYNVSKITPDLLKVYCNGLPFAIGGNDAAILRQVDPIFANGLRFMNSSCFATEDPVIVVHIDSVNGEHFMHRLIQRLDH